MINGVLRQFQRQQEELLAEFNASDARYLHPSWLLKRLQKAYPEQWQSIVEANNQRPPMWLRINRTHHSRDSWLGKIFANPHLPGIDDYYEPFDFDYQNLHTAPEGIHKLFKRQEVAPTSSGLMFRLMPWVLISSMLVLAMALPLFITVSPFAGGGDLITLIYLLALFRFFFALPWRKSTHYASKFSLIYSVR